MELPYCKLKESLGGGALRALVLKIYVSQLILNVNIKLMGMMELGGLFTFIYATCYQEAKSRETWRD